MDFKPEFFVEMMVVECACRSKVTIRTAALKNMTSFMLSAHIISSASEGI